MRGFHVRRTSKGRFVRCSEPKVGAKSGGPPVINRTGWQTALLRCGMSAVLTARFGPHRVMTRKAQVEHIRSAFADESGRRDGHPSLPAQCQERTQRLTGSRAGGTGAMIGTACGPSNAMIHIGSARKHLPEIRPHRGQLVRPVLTLASLRVRPKITFSLEKRDYSGDHYRVPAPTLFSVLRSILTSLYISRQVIHST
jgi:hypothetical protein